MYEQGAFNDQYLLTLSDTVVAGANIFQVAAKDSDSGVFKQLRFDPKVPGQRALHQTEHAHGGQHEFSRFGKA